MRLCHVGNNGPHLITEVNQRWAWSVLAWVTGWEYRVLQAFFFGPALLIAFAVGENDWSLPLAVSCLDHTHVQATILLLLTSYHILTV